MAKLSKNIIDRMVENIPFQVSAEIVPYLLEAMDIYAKEKVKEDLIIFMRYYKNNVPIGTQKGSVEIIEEYLDKVENNPQPLTPPGIVLVNAKEVLVLNSKKDWINKVPRLLPTKLYDGESFLWLDKLGNTVAIGEDFSLAEEVDTYPITVYRTKRVKDYKLNK